MSHGQLHDRLKMSCGRRMVLNIAGLCERLPILRAMTPTVKSRIQDRESKHGPSASQISMPSSQPSVPRGTHLFVDGKHTPRCYIISRSHCSMWHRRKLNSREVDKT